MGEDTKVQKKPQNMREWLDSYQIRICYKGFEILAQRARVVKSYVTETSKANMPARAGE